MYSLIDPHLKVRGKKKATSKVQNLAQQARQAREKQEKERRKMEIQELQNRQPQQRVLNCNQFAIQRSKERMRRSQRERRAQSENKTSMAHCLAQQARQQREGEKKLFDHQKNRQRYRSN
ncbi:hypothetical protein C5167_016433 [Papaver somniferum]|nr:hypothetical protein C5167_016433 [Papaver somniferum]